MCAFVIIHMYIYTYSAVPGPWRQKLAFSLYILNKRTDISEKGAQGIHKIVINLGVLALSANSKMTGNLPQLSNGIASSLT